MTQKVYGLIRDNGDGSAGIVWFRSMEEVDEMLDEENDHEEYWGNEGSPAEELTFPDSVDLAAAGFRFHTN